MKVDDLFNFSLQLKVGWHFYQELKPPSKMLDLPLKLATAIV